MKSDALTELLLQDGHIAKSSSGDEVLYTCINPHHNDDSPSMYINQTKGIYYCHGCQITGNAYHYLINFRNLSKEAAIELLKGEFGWKDDRIKLSEHQFEEAILCNAGLPRKVTDLPTEGVIAHHDYKLSNDTLVCRMLRFKQRESSSARPKYLPFVPRSQGGWWQCSPIATNLPGEDRKTSKCVLYNLKLVENSNKDTFIYIVESEKCADSLGSAKDGPQPGPPITTTYARFIKGFDRTDFEPLCGRKVFLIADRDAVGRTYMLKLGEYLTKYINPKIIKYFLPEGEDGYNVADAIAEGGWNKFANWIRGNIVEHSDLASTAELSPARRLNTADKLSTMEFESNLVRRSKKYFDILGVNGNYLVFKNKAIHLIQPYKASSLSTDSVLMALAPPEFWYQIAGGKREFSKKIRLAIQDCLIREAKRRGVFDVSCSIGRGAYRLSDGTIHYNLGDSILSCNNTGHLSSQSYEMCCPEQRKVIIGGPRIEIKDDDRAEKWALDLFRAVKNYRFEDASMAHAFLGWMVSALIGGALDFRPVVWLVAPASTGKTYLLDTVLRTFFRECLLPLNDATRAGLIYVMKNDSLAIYHDDFEPRSHNKDRWKGILSLVRMASTGTGYRARGKVNNSGSTMIRPRFSSLLSSINLPRSSDVNESEFFVVRLSHQGVEDWKGVDRRIQSSVASEKMLAVRSYIIRNTLKIYNLISEKEQFYASRGLGIRESKLLAALSGGASFLGGDEGLIIERGDTTSFESDLLRPLCLILKTHIRTSGGETTTLSEELQFLIKALVDSKLQADDRVREKKNLLSQHGFRLNEVKSGNVITQLQIYIVSDSNILHKLLEPTGLDIDLRSYLTSHNHIKDLCDKSGRRKRLRFAGQVRYCMVLEQEILVKLGLLPSGGITELANQIIR